METLFFIMEWDICLNANVLWRVAMNLTVKWIILLGGRLFMVRGTRTSAESCMYETVEQKLCREHSTTNIRWKLKTI